MAISYSTDTRAPTGSYVREQDGARNETPEDRRRDLARAGHQDGMRDGLTAALNDAESMWIRRANSTSLPAY